MKKEKNKKFHFRLPKLTPLNLILMILIPIVVFFVIAIPVLYVNSYNANKVSVFSSQLEELDETARKDVIYGNKNKIEDFEFVLYCTNYDNESGTIKFKAFAYENEKTRNVIDLSKQISVQLGMYSNWIKCEQTSSKYNKYIGTGANVAMTQSRSYFDFTISNVPKLPKKGDLPFINIKTIPLYAYITYSTIINGTETTKRYILKYEYNDYVIGSNKIEDTREKELNVSSSYIQWRYKNDTSWTNAFAISDLTGVEVRNSDTHIQWKRKCDTDWINYKSFDQLSGYSDGLTPSVKIENSAIYYRFDEDSTWQYLVSCTSLTEIEVRVDNNYIQWKRKWKTDWNNLKNVTELKDYDESNKVETRVSGSKVQWRYSNSSTWNDLVTTDSLIGVMVQFNTNKDLQWKCVDETDWKNVIINNVLQTEKNLDTNELKYGPTSGGI